jgi:hypothetical protein
MSKPDLASTFIARLRARRHPAAVGRTNHNGDTMSTIIESKQALPRARPTERNVAALITCLVTIILSFVPLVGFTTTAARACACGCSVFDVGGLDLPQEEDHGGRVFLEYWSGDQTQNYVGGSKAPGSLNTDKEINTQWIKSASATTSIAIGA